MVCTTSWRGVVRLESSNGMNPCLRDPGQTTRDSRLSTLEQQDCHLTEVKVYEVFGLVSDVASKVPTNDHMPGSRDERGENERGECDARWVCRTTDKCRQLRVSYHVGEYLRSNS